LRQQVDGETAQRGGVAAFCGAREPAAREIVTAAFFMRVGKRDLCQAIAGIGTMFQRCVR
jgi:hypothetical protein